MSKVSRVTSGSHVVCSFSLVLTGRERGVLDLPVNLDSSELNGSVI